MNYKLLFVLFTLLALTACSVPAPKYSPSYDNVQLLKKANSKVDVSKFKGAKPELGSITLRGNTLTSPYGKDFIHYLQTALESEFQKAGLLKKGSSKTLSALIEENDIDTSGFSVANGKIKATFLVQKKGRTLYKKSIAVTKQWESSFIGAVAIPRAAETYPLLVNDLLRKLYSDRKFISALKG